LVLPIEHERPPFSEAKSKLDNPDMDEVLSLLLSPSVPKPPKNTPAYHTKDHINCLVQATKNKQSHKKLARRDAFIIELAIKTGMRRSELANLLVGEIDFEHRKIQILGKGDKTRTTPLVKSTAQKIERF
jgi:site-specific recombinase XerD